MTKTNQSKHNLILVSIVGIVAIIALILMSTTNNLQSNVDLTGQAYFKDTLCDGTESWVPPCDNECEEQYEFDVVLESFGARDLADKSFICADKYSQDLKKFSSCIANLEKQSLSEGINPSTWKSDAMNFICNKIKYTEANKAFTTAYC